MPLGTSKSTLLIPYRVICCIVTELTPLPFLSSGELSALARFRPTTPSPFIKTDDLILMLHAAWGNSLLPQKGTLSPSYREYLDRRDTPY